MKNQWQGHENHTIRINVFTICIEVRAEPMITKTQSYHDGHRSFLTTKENLKQEEGNETYR